MANFAGQSTDGENAKAVPKSVARDNDLKTSSRGASSAIAKESNSGQQSNTGKGATAVTASIK